MPRQQPAQHAMTDDQIAGACARHARAGMVGGRGERQQDGLLAKALIDRHSA